MIFNAIAFDCATPKRTTITTNYLSAPSSSSDTEPKYLMHCLPKRQLTTPAAAPLILYGPPVLTSFEPPGGGRCRNLHHKLSLYLVITCLALCEPIEASNYSKILENSGEENTTTVSLVDFSKIDRVCIPSPQLLASSPTSRTASLFAILLLIRINKPSSEEVLLIFRLSVKNISIIERDINFHRSQNLSTTTHFNFKTSILLIKNEMFKVSC